MSRPRVNRKCTAGTGSVLSMVSPLVLASLTLALQMSGFAVTPALQSSAVCRFDCRIAFDQPVELRGKRDSDFFQKTRLLASRDSSGNFVVVGSNRTELAVFTAAGVELALVKGFGAIGGLVGTEAGPVRVYDRTKRSLITLGSLYKPSQQVEMSIPPVIELADGVFVGTVQIPSPKFVGYPMHILDSEGKHLRSIGPEGFVPGRTPSLTRVINQGRGGTIIAAAPGRYVIERWNPTVGRMLSSLVVKEPEFLASETDREFTTTVGDKQRWLIEALWENSGVFWTLVRIGDVRWKPTPESGSEVAYDHTRYQRKHDWLLQAVDPDSGNVIASHRFDAKQWPILNQVLLISDSPRGGILVTRPRLVPR